jgi:hypothetical protein
MRPSPISVTSRSLSFCAKLPPLPGSVEGNAASRRPHTDRIVRQAECQEILQLNEAMAGSVEGRHELQVLRGLATILT